MHMHSIECKIQLLTAIYSISLVAKPNIGCASNQKQRYTKEEVFNKCVIALLLPFHVDHIIQDCVIVCRSSL